MAAFPQGIYKNITGAGTTVIKSGQGRLYGVNINKALGGTVAIKDSTVTIGTLTNGTGSPIGPQFDVPVGISFQSLSATLASAEDITIFYE